MYKLAVFDLDGTLVDSVYDLADAVNAALAERGYPTHDTDKYYRFVGNGTLKLCERALPEDKRNDAEISSLHTRFAEIYGSICLNKTRPYVGIPELIRGLGEAGLLCAVASNKTDSFSREIVASLFPADSFALVMGKRDGVPTKPAPDIVLAIANEFGVDINDAVMIGDSSVDVRTAHNAGIKCIGCTWGFRGEQELREAGCDHIAHTPEDIYGFIINS